MNTYGAYVNQVKTWIDDDKNHITVTSFIDGSNLIEVGVNFFTHDASVELTSVQMIELGKILIENGQKQIDLREE